MIKNKIQVNAVSSNDSKIMMDFTNKQSFNIYQSHTKKGVNMVWADIIIEIHEEIYSGDLEYDHGQFYLKAKRKLESIIKMEKQNKLSKEHLQKKFFDEDPVDLCKKRKTSES